MALKVGGEWSYLLFCFKVREMGHSRGRTKMRVGFPLLFEDFFFGVIHGVCLRIDFGVERFQNMVPGGGYMFFLLGEDTN